MSLIRYVSFMLSAAVLISCYSPVEASDRMHPQSMVLLVTPKMIHDFNQPDGDIAEFFRHYSPLTSKAAETVVIFAVGNSDHILSYRGMGHWNDSIDWARTTDFIPVSDATLDYYQLEKIVRAFRTAAAAMKIEIKVFDHIDSGSEFTLRNDFKYVRHPECTANQWGMFDIRGSLERDDVGYATAPEGIAKGTTCGDFLAAQTAAYVHDLGFDGIMFDNQLGTRGRWHDGDGPGYSDAEALAIDGFLAYSRKLLGTKGLMWFDSYNNVLVERETFSFPYSGYGYFDYLIASGFCVTEKTRPYSDNLKSKIDINEGPRILATLDYVDPWYTYNSMTDYAGCSTQLEQTAVDFRYDIDGLMFFANDERGVLVPQTLIKSFAERYYGN